MMNQTGGWMGAQKAAIEREDAAQIMMNLFGGWDGGGVWGWMLAGILAIALLIVLDKKLLMLKK